MSTHIINTQDLERRAALMKKGLTPSQAARRVRQSNYKVGKIERKKARAIVAKAGPCIRASDFPSEHTEA